MNEPEKILDEIVTRCKIEEHVKESIDFMLDALDLIAGRFPPEAKGIFLRAKSFHGGKGDREEIEKARKECWKINDKLPSPYTHWGPDVCALRALICVLYPKDGYEDIEQVLNFFLMVSNVAEDHKVEQCQLLKDHFSAYV